MRTLVLGFAVALTAASPTNIPEPEGLPAFVIYEGLESYRVQTSGDLAGHTPTVSWSRLLSEALSNFRSAPAMAREFQWRTEVLVAIGVLMAGEYTPFDTANLGTLDFRQNVLPTIYRSRTLQETAYQWAWPHFLESYRELPTNVQLDYLVVIAHAKSYLASFDLERERAYWRSLEEGKCKEPDAGKMWLAEYRARPGYAVSPCVPLFTRLGPDNKPNPYRKLEAFIFRRAVDGWSIEDQLYWVDKVYDDLMGEYKTARKR